MKTKLTIQELDEARERLRQIYNSSEDEEDEDEEDDEYELITII